MYHLLNLYFEILYKSFDDKFKMLPSSGENVDLVIFRFLRKHFGVKYRVNKLYWS